MNFHPWSESISQYFDGELTPEEQSKAIAHLATCSECSRQLYELGEIRTKVRAAADVELPYGFANEIVRSLDQEDLEVVSWLGVEHYARKVVLALAVLVLSFIFLTSFNEMNQPLPLDRRITGELIDSLETHVLLKQAEISKQDVFLAVVSK